MKRIVAIILMMCLMLGVCACSKNTSESPANENSSIADYSHITPDTIELYIDTSFVIDSSNQGSGQTKTMSSVIKEKAEDAKIDLYFTEEYEDVKKTDIAEKKTFEISSQEHELTYTSTRVYSNMNTTNKYFNRSVNNYSWDNGGNKKISVTISSDTNRIVQYLDTEVRKWSEGEVIHDEATLREIANEMLTSNIEEDVLKDYVAREISYPKDFRNKYGLYYDRYIYGYQTRESIYIVIDQNKKITTCQFEKSGMFNEIEENFSKEHIDAVANALQNKIENTINMANILISEPVLTFDTNGVLYVAIQIRYLSSTADETIYAKVG